VSATGAGVERFADAGRGVRLCYEELVAADAPADAPVVLLVRGLGLDLSWWRDDFCAALAARGFRVVRFDNRDVGRSSALRGPGVSALGFLRRRADPVYTLGDMADDAAGLIAALAPAGGGVHVVGASLGAFVAQELAIRHPGRTLSLTSIMGRPGDGRTGKVSRRMIPEFLRSGPSDPAGATEHLVKSFHRIGSRRRTAEDDADVRAVMTRSLAREQGDGSGSGRQLAAILAERDRTADLRALRLPALVVHGLHDKVVLPSGGRATAAAIPGAELLEIPDMGHDLARWTWPAVLDGIERTARRAAATGQAGQAGLPSR
jgi:pimeloyl-ACP methyl ester carboxylesterase